MLVTIELFGVQRDIAQADTIIMPITEGTLLRDALEYVARKYPTLILGEESVLVAVNGAVVPLDNTLKANDVISIVPHIGGG
jgi:molybdopterin converting factor small subunit